VTVEIVIAVVSVVAAALLVLPLVRQRRDLADRSEYDLAVYRQQLADVDADIARGVMSPEEGESVKLEVERRMLKASRTKDEAKPIMKQRSVLALIVLVAVPAASLALYQYQGSPDLPGQPFAERSPSKAPNRAKIVELLQRVEQRLKSNPNDKRGWRLLGQGYMSLGETGKAAETFKQAAKIFPDDPDIMSSFGEALVMDSNGVVGPEALRIFQSVHKADPTMVAPRYYIGLASFQAGEIQQAYDQWRALAVDSPANAPWLATVQRGLDEAAKKLGKTPEKVGQLAKAAAPTTMPQPSKEAVDAAQNMTPEQRESFIRSMVGRLAARLKESPDDLDGWLRLAQSYTVLGERKEAAGAYRKAMGLMKDDDPRRPEIENRINALSKS
jgi:cytochrome c-type biogenesis protein CcmH